VSIAEKLASIAAGTPQSDVVAGSEQERAISENLRAFLESLGLETGVYEFEALSWEERYVEVGFKGLKLRSVALPYSLPGEAEGKVVYVGGRILEDEWASIDLSGKIALVKFFSKVDEAEWQYIRAVRAGAEAVVFMDNYPNRLRKMVLTLNTDYRFTEGTPPPIPAVAVSLEDGLRILKLAHRGEKLLVRVDTKVDHYSRSRVVYAGSLEGPVFSAHIDKWLSGFTDDVLGVGVVMLLAERLRDSAGYIFFGSEESGAPGYSPWYWIWGSRSFAEYLEKTGLLDDFGMLLNVDTLGGREVRVSASTPDVQEGIADAIGSSARICPDQVIFDSFSFTMKGIPSTTTHTFPEVLPVYHTDMDTPAFVDWQGVERAVRVLERIATEFAAKRWGMFKYAELTRRIAERLERVSHLPSAAKAVELLQSLRLDSEESARQVRRALTGPMFWGRYDRVFRDSEVYYPLFTDAIDDLVLLSDILAGARSPADVAGMKGLRRISGFEVVLPSVEPVFYGRVLSSPGFLKELYLVLERVVEKDINTLVERLQALKK